MATKQWSARPENAGAVGVCETHGFKSAAQRQIKTLRLNYYDMEARSPPPHPTP